MRRALMLLPLALAACDDAPPQALLEAERAVMQYHGRIIGALPLRNSSEAALDDHRLIADACDVVITDDVRWRKHRALLCLSTTETMATRYGIDYDIAEVDRAERLVRSVE